MGQLALAQGSLGKLSEKWGKREMWFLFVLLFTLFLLFDPSLEAHVVLRWAKRAEFSKAGCCCLPGLVFVSIPFALWVQYQWKWYKLIFSLILLAEVLMLGHVYNLGQRFLKRMYRTKGRPFSWYILGNLWLPLKGMCATCSYILNFGNCINLNHENISFWGNIFMNFHDMLDN